MMNRLKTAQLSLEFVTVLHNYDHWIVRVKSQERLAEQKIRNFEAFLSEIGVPFRPNLRIQVVLDSLESGLSASKTMERYRVAVVVHGEPITEEVKAFRQSFIDGIGYCPPTLA